MKKNVKLIASCTLVVMILIAMTCTAFAASRKAELSTSATSATSESISGRTSHAYGKNISGSSGDMKLKWYYSYGSGWTQWKALTIAPGSNSTTDTAYTQQDTLWYIRLEGNNSTSGYGYVYNN